MRAGTVSRRVERVDSGDLGTAKAGIWSGYVYPTPEPLGLPYSDVQIPVENGMAPAWKFTPSRRPETLPLGPSISMAWADRKPAHSAACLLRTDWDTHHWLFHSGTTAILLHRRTAGITWGRPNGTTLKLRCPMPWGKVHAR